jgi:hypothetical protein
LVWCSEHFPGSFHWIVKEAMDAGADTHGNKATRCRHIDCKYAPDQISADSVTAFGSAITFNREDKNLNVGDFWSGGEEVADGPGQRPAYLAFICEMASMRC